jgi:hypothetical protein
MFDTCGTHKKELGIDYTFANKIIVDENRYVFHASGYVAVTGVGKNTCVDYSEIEQDWNKRYVSA